MGETALTWPGVPHYFESHPQVPSEPGSVDLVLTDLHLRLRTDRGVFSGDRVDPGTRVLLESVPPPPEQGDLLDLGCGYGPIALTMASRSPTARVWAVDTNERALALCVRNAGEAGLAGVRCRAPEAVDPGLRFAAIWSNPPVRIGKPALHDLLTTWLPRLAPGGRAHLVVHRHLGADSLHRWLAERGFAASRVTSRSGYRVLRVAALEVSDDDGA